VYIAVLFGMAHWESGAHEILGTACLGLFACALYLKIQTLWPLIGAHFIVDMASFS
jgi:membrane protease YdiL (CAAX protease family)